MEADKQIIVNRCQEIHDSLNKQTSIVPTDTMGSYGVNICEQNVSALDSKAITGELAIPTQQDEHMKVTRMPKPLLRVCKPRKRKHAVKTSQ